MNNFFCPGSLETTKQRTAWDLMDDPWFARIPDDPEPRRKMARMGEERKEGYLVVRNRLKRGTLHLASRSGCWTARTRKFKD